MPKFWCVVCDRFSFRSEAVFAIELLDESGRGLSFPRILLCEKHTRSMCKVVSDETDLSILVRVV